MVDRNKKESVKKDNLKRKIQTPPGRGGLKSSTIKRIVKEVFEDQKHGR